MYTATRPVFCLVTGLAFCLALEANADARQAYSQASPSWMGAVGKLDVPGQKWENADRHNYQEHCTATLMGTGSSRSRSSRYILTAWHCLEHYGDLSKPIMFSLPLAGITREATIVTSGGSMKADWALLKLRKPVSQEQVRPFPTHNTAEVSVTLTMAGYSSDENLGQGGAVLTYDAQCQRLNATDSAVTTNCTAMKGASGGPVVAQVGNSVQLLGVISAGDSISRSLYAPTRLFASSLRLYLAP